MIELRLFGRCRIYHDPVTPVLKSPCKIGWESWFRKIDLQTPRRLKGEELLLRTKGWWTVEPQEVLEVIQPLAQLKVGKKGQLLVQTSSKADMKELEKVLEQRFKDQILLSP